ncbi:MAG TPA: amino acid adenylation domain-containing protein [Candidatus Angelobacter sp.]|nr:amino acid adenylation domain-containing protein [Candidatus Angelobacter sp.]
MLTTSNFSYRPVPRTNVRVHSLNDLLELRAMHDRGGAAYTFLTDGEGAETAISYKELDGRARAIASRIMEQAQPGDRALLLYAPGLEFLPAFFACLYGRIIAVPAYPPHRNRNLLRLLAIVRDAQPKVILTTAALLAKLRAAMAESVEFRGIDLLATDAVPQECAHQYKRPVVERDTVAFLQYTSGSTNNPKGVMITHENLLHNAAAVYHAVEQGPSDSYVSWLPVFHDMGFMAGVLQPIYAGSPCMQMSPAAFLEKPARWLKAISHYKATTSGGPNFAYELCVNKIPEAERSQLDLSSWSVAFNGAEPIRAETVARFTAAFAPCGFRENVFYPCYGLAEATLMVSGGSRRANPVVRRFEKKSLENHQVNLSHEGSPSSALVGCGGSLPDQEVAIVDPVELSPTQQIGEIWVKGPSVAAGYWNSPEETGHAFHAFIKGTGDGPFLRTGDLGFMNNGELFIAGRLKDLLIIRGQNHYPQDIELTVERCDAILPSGCGAAFSVDFNGEERLVVVQEAASRKDSDLAKTIQLIRQRIAEVHELAPCAVVLVRTSTIPKTSSGKIQRHACKAAFLSESLKVIKEWHEGEAIGKGSSDAPVENRAAWLIAELAAKLGVDPATIDVGQPLTAYSLDSLTAVELAHSLQSEFGIDVKWADLFEGLTIANILNKAEPALKPKVTDQQETYPLSHGQKALWFIHQMAPSSAAYNISRALRIRSALNVPALRDCFQALVDRHPSLRTIFSSVASQPIQRVEQGSKAFFQHVDASKWNDSDLREALVQESHRAFDLFTGPVFRVHLFSRSENDHILHVAVHHIVADFWSLMLLLDEVGKLYEAHRQKTEAQLQPLNRSYADLVAWHHQLLAGAEGERLRTYWMRELSGEIAPLNLPADRRRLPVQTFSGASLPFVLGKTLTRQLKELGAQQQTTLFITLLAGFQVLLHRITGQKQIVVGSPTSGRPRVEFANVVGYFVNPLPLRADFSERIAFSQFMAQLRKTVMGAFAHELYPFPLLVEALGIPRDFSSSPVFQTMFVFQKAYGNHSADFVRLALAEPGAKLKMGELQLESFAVEERASQFDLSLTMGETEEGLGGSWQYNSDLFERATVERWAECFRVLLEVIVAAPERLVSALPIMPEQERRELLTGFNQTTLDYDRQECLHQRIERQVTSTPDKAAIVWNQTETSYGELDAQANQIARYLSSLGVNPGDLAGICMRRSPTMVAAMLGIWKAGSAYVPLDPQYPEERLKLMLADSGAKVLITEEGLHSKVKDSPAIVCIDKDWDRLTQMKSDRPNVEVNSQQMAYLIYTSGSTGVPKGVMLSHRNAMSFVTWAENTFSAEEFSGVLATTSVCFDLSIFELWATLSCGGTIVLADDILQWWESLQEEKSHGRVRLVNTVPSAIARLIQRGRLPESVCTVNLAGEALKDSLVSEIYSAGNVKRVNNLYGPTETTTYSSWTTVPEQQEVTIGSAVANTRLYVLDGELELVPQGVLGELYVAGAGVAHGYWKHPDRTAERFVPDPVSNQGGERMYRTGDIVRWRSNRELEYLGRADQQVKVRGYRIELEEIASVLGEHADVYESVVIVREHAGDKRLAAYASARPGVETSEEALKQYLEKRLPRYMVPSSITLLENLPKTPNGKIDRKALPNPDRIAHAGKQKPRNDVEKKITEIWQEVLGVEQVGIEEDFFALGGHSLLATQVMVRVENSFSMKIPLSKLFESSTVAAMARCIESENSRHDLPRMKRIARNSLSQPVVVELVDAGSEVSH